MQLLHDVGLPEFERELLAAAGWKPEQIEIVPQAIANAGSDLFSDLELSLNGLRVMSLVDAGASLRDMRRAIDIRVSTLGEEVRQLTEVERSMLDSRRSEITNALEAGVPSTALAATINQFAVDVRALVLETNNLTVLDDLEFALAARVELQQFDAGTTALSTAIDSLHTAGELSQTAVDDLRISVAGIDDAYGRGEFDEAATLLGELLLFVDGRVGVDVSESARNALVQHVSYIESFGAGGSFQDDLLLLDDIQPTLTAAADRSVAEGALLSIVDIGLFTDPAFDNPIDANGNGIEAFLYSIDWGDGTAPDVGTSTVDSPGSILELTRGSFDGAHRYADDGVYTVTVTVTDVNDATAAATFLVTVLNVPPTSDAGSDQTVNEGELVSLDGSFSDPGTLDTHTFLWQVTASNGQVIADGTTEDFSFTPHDNGTYTIAFTVTDDDGGSHTDEVVVTVLNVAPQNVAISGPAAAVRGQTLYYGGSFTDPGSADTHTFAWQAIDPSGALVASGSDVEFGFIPTVTGEYLLVYSVTDDNGGQATSSRSLSVAAVAMQGGDLVVGGTIGDDQLVFTRIGRAGDIKVLLNGASLGIFQPSGRLVAYGQAGDDNLQVAGSITVSAWLYGDAGHDRLKGGAGDDVLLGGSGDDLLLGGTGRDLLIGGTGSDRLVGNPGDDILIAGFTAFDYRPAGLLQRHHDEAMQAIMDEWTRTDRTASQRIANLRGDVDGDGLNGDWKLNAATVGNDADADTLTGAQGEDWFLFDDELDDATDLKDEAFSNDLEFILS